jgi:hypothetical protein
VKRRFWHCPRLDDPGTFEEKMEHTNDRKEVPRFRANLVGSLLQDRKTHAPVLDLDFPAALVPSTTKGHFHLYLDKELTWEQYEQVLLVLGDVGILEPGYVDASIRRKQTFVRKKGVKKQEGAADSGGVAKKKPMQITQADKTYN